ncbi:DinB family protein [Variovorax arabinosiphilus]|uniref:DinB family protein n=1 Tax=Variovorax arabinosiphilus TaxID=3053498 RepID=UPI002575CEC8|nr:MULTISPECIES: DinB family protein [unclassified Variovorax]MDM0123388.1 DinB family protein [Variovorax sp. J2L1-78]MDM0132447.1 DinB family protein [Variovorax sp. J2L1-63]MDM0231020.1 DinB family protein [Variovorax sp. J2R1-6]
MQIADYFIRLARYHAWATHKLLTDLTALSDDEWHRDMRLFFGSVHRTVNHLLVADTIWYARFAENTSRRIALDAELHASRAELCAALAAAVNRWAPWVEAMDASRLDGDLVYTRTDGEAARIPFAPALGHIFNHATHHRGQITAGVTAMGHGGPSLDWASLLQIEARSPT